MMMKLLYLITAALIILPVTGCGSSSDNDEIEIKPAPIHELSVTFAKSLPPQVIVYIKGGLADSCTAFHELKTERSGNMVTITVTVQRPRDAICAEVYGFFERYENLGSEFTPGENYTVNVNDKSTSFVLP
jgi:hypothetical protein